MAFTRRFQADFTKEERSLIFNALLVDAGSHMVQANEEGELGNRELARELREDERTLRRLAELFAPENEGI